MNAYKVSVVCNKVMILTLNVRLMRDPPIFSNYVIVRVLELSFTCSLCSCVYNFIYLDISVFKNALYKTFQMRVVLSYHDLHVCLPLFLIAKITNKNQMIKYKILYMYQDI